MALRLYFDEDSNARALMQALRARGLDVEGAVEAGMIERLDPEHLDYATAHGRVLYTFNVGDFFGLHAELLRAGKSHAGLILAPQQRYSVGEQMRRVLRLSQARTPEQMRDRVEFLSAW